MIQKLEQEPEVSSGMERLQQESLSLATQEEADRQAKKVDDIRRETDEVLQKFLEAEREWRSTVAEAAQASARIEAIANANPVNEQAAMNKQQEQRKTSEHMREAVLVQDQSFQEFLQRVRQEGQTP